MHLYTLATMADLNVTFPGLALTSPLIVEFRDEIPPPGLATEIAEAGAGALLLPPLNEARLEWSEDESELTEHNRSDAAIRENDRMRRSINRDAYLDKVRGLSSSVSVPVIAALQSTRRSQWLNFARMMTDAGAGAVELHPISEPAWRSSRSDRIDKEILRTASSVATRLDTSVIVRLVAAPYGLQALVQGLGESDVKAIVLSESAYLSTIDTDTSTTDSRSVGGRRGDAAHMNALAALQLLYRRVSPHLAAFVPPDRSAALTESILAGATLTVLPVQSGGDDDVPAIVAEYLNSLRGWMRRKGFSSLFDFRGSLSDSRRSSSLENRPK